MDSAGDVVLSASAEEISGFPGVVVAGSGGEVVWGSVRKVVPTACSPVGGVAHKCKKIKNKNNVTDSNSSLKTHGFANSIQYTQSLRSRNKI